MAIHVVAANILKKVAGSALKRAANSNRQNIDQFQPTNVLFKASLVALAMTPLFVVVIVGSSTLGGALSLITSVFSKAATLLSPSNVAEAADEEVVPVGDLGCYVFDSSWDTGAIYTVPDARRSQVSTTRMKEITAESIQHILGVPGARSRICTGGEITLRLRPDEDWNLAPSGGNYIELSLMAFDDFVNGQTSHTNLYALAHESSHHIYYRHSDVRTLYYDLGANTEGLLPTYPRNAYGGNIPSYEYWIEALGLYLLLPNQYPILRDGVFFNNFALQYPKSYNFAKTVFETAP